MDNNKIVKKITLLYKLGGSSNIYVYITVVVNGVILVLYLWHDFTK
jgi:hypothetical protein